LKNLDDWDFLEVISDHTSQYNNKKENGLSWQILYYEMGSLNSGTHQGQYIKTTFHQVSNGFYLAQAVPECNWCSKATIHTSGLGFMLFYQVRMASIRACSRV
jgi:hypothetical protein